MNFAKNYPLIERGDEKVKAGQCSTEFVLQYVQVALGGEWPRFYFLFGGTKFMHAQYINL